MTISRKIHIIGITACSCLAVILLTIFLNKTDEPKTQITNVVEVPSEEEEITSSKDVFVTDNINDENSAIISEPSNTVSFWYVYYNVHIKTNDVTYNGYSIIRCTHPYFDVEEAVLSILPNYTKNDFVGIQFFKRVPLESYNAFIKFEP